jgi:hypothetical protein
MKCKLCIIGFLVFFCAVAYAAEHPWQLKKEKEGISVSTRKVDGSPVLEYKANTIASAPLAKVISVFEDDAKIPLWYYQCVHAEVVGGKLPDQKIYYVVMHLPWPVTERDSIFQGIRSIDPASGVVTYTQSALPTYLPERKGKIRVLYLKSVWRFTSLADGSTEIYFQQHSNPGGSVPGFLVNSLSVEIPFYSLKNLRNSIDVGVQ